MSRAADKLFTGPCTFARGITALEQLPVAHRPEVAFVGRSNVGKSSLLNALTGRKLAHVSKTPGRTQQLNFFNLGDKMWLVDMPGYGYAAAAKRKVAGWTRLAEGYLSSRSSLRQVCLLIDSRHGLKDSDLAALELMEAAGLTTQIVLTKGDAPKPPELAETVAAVEAMLARQAVARPKALVTSGRTGEGIAALREELMQLLD